MEVDLNTMLLRHLSTDADPQKEGVWQLGMQNHGLGSTSGTTQCGQAARSITTGFYSQPAAGPSSGYSSGSQQQQCASGSGAAAFGHQVTIKAEPGLEEEEGMPLEDVHTSWGSKGRALRRSSSIPKIKQQREGSKEQLRSKKDKQMKVSAASISNGKAENDLMLLDPKRIKRILANRQSAAKSKERKVKYTMELEQRMAVVQEEQEQLDKHISNLKADSKTLTVYNADMASKVLQLQQQLNQLLDENKALMESSYSLQALMGMEQQLPDFEFVPDSAVPELPKLLAPLSQQQPQQSQQQSPQPQDAPAAPPSSAEPALRKRSSGGSYPGPATGPAPAPAPALASSPRFSGGGGSSMAPSSQVQAPVQRPPPAQHTQHQQPPAKQQRSLPNPFHHAAEAAAGSSGIGATTGAPSPFVAMATGAVPLQRTPRVSSGSDTPAPSTSGSFPGLGLALFPVRTGSSCGGGGSATADVGSQSPPFPGIHPPAQDWSPQLSPGPSLPFPSPSRGLQSFSPPSISDQQLDDMHFPPYHTSFTLQPPFTAQYGMDMPQQQQQQQQVGLRAVVTTGAAEFIVATSKPSRTAGNSNLWRSQSFDDMLQLQQEAIDY